VNAGGVLSLSQAAKVHFVRPSAEPLFESAALVFGPRAIAVVLTGGDGDGSDGVRFIRKAGGIVIAQDPASCPAPSMPESAIATGDVHHVLPLGEIGPALVRLVTGRSPASLLSETGS
jgi:two-component system chemotaxis response regulator CheB